MVTGILICIIISTAALFAGVVFWRKRPGPKRIVARSAIIIGLFLISLLLLIYGVGSMRHNLEILGWPDVQGEVISSEVAGSRAFHPEIVYRYEINGREFRNTSHVNSPGFGGKTNRLDAAEKIVAKYPPATRITVYYDPNSPGRSYLRRGITYGIYLQLTFGIMLFGSGIFLLIPVFKKRQ
jgi:hypothetical protein